MMNYDFENEARIRIPKEAYLPYKRCEFCQSVYLTDNICETCGRSVRFDLIGPIGGFKSFYGIKERYINELSPIAKYFPIFESISSSSANSYKRQLKKRLKDLSHIEESDDKNLLDLECTLIIDELLYFHTPATTINSLVLNNWEIQNYLSSASLNVTIKPKFMDAILNYRVGDVLRVKFILFTFTLLTVLFSLVVFSLRSGK
jgi:hypothetical protein